MKKKTLTIACCAALLSISSVAYSAAGPYVSGNVGLAIANDSDVTLVPGITVDVESDSGLALGAAAGYAFEFNTRVEAEIVYQKNDLDEINIFGLDLDLSGDTSSTALLFNGYYDFNNASAFTPFIGAGIGVANVEVNDFNILGLGGLPDDDDTVFAYQVGAGVAYAINENIDIDVKYRYFATSDPEFDITEIEYSSHNIYAGVRIGF
jgi:opacity protein-like surface antigen